MKNLDRWLPKGIMQSSSEGAFERFLTAAIATIITIIFSWRMLDKINEDKKEDEDEPERHRLGNFSPLSQPSSFVSLSPLSKEGSGVTWSVSHRQRNRSTQFGKQTESLTQRVVSLSDSSLKRDLPAGGVQLFGSDLNSIVRVPVDLPLCGDIPQNVAGSLSSIFSTTGKVSGVPCDSDEVFFSKFTCDSCADNQLPSRSIDCASPGASLRGEAQQPHVLAITAHRSEDTLSQHAGSLDSHTEGRVGCDTTSEDSLYRVVAGSYNNSNLEQVYDFVDFTDSSLEDAEYNDGYNHNFDCLEDNNKDNYKNIVGGEIHQQFPFPANTTDDRNSIYQLDGNFITSSDGSQDLQERGYDFDDDDVQPRELDSEEELFCCSILEPIIEEDSDEMTSSEGDTSRSERDYNSLKDTRIDGDVNRKRGSISDDTIFAERYGCKTEIPISLEPRKDLEAFAVKYNEQNIEVLRQRSASDPSGRIPDLGNLNAKFVNINTSQAASPDREGSRGDEAGSSRAAARGGTHSEIVHAQIFAPNDSVKCDGRSSSTRDEHFQYIRSFGSSVDQILPSFVSDYSQKGDASGDNFSDSFNHSGKNINVDITAKNFEFVNESEDQLVTRSFLQTFSTRVEVEDSNSESDESVQTVISRQTSREQDGSPLYGQGLISGLRSASRYSQRPHSDGFLYSSKIWKNEEVATVRGRNVSEGGGDEFNDDAKSEGDITELWPEHSNFHSLAYKSNTAQDLNLLVDDNFEVKMNDRFTYIRREDSLGADDDNGVNNHDGVFNRRFQNSSRSDNTNNRSWSASGRRLAEFSEQMDIRDSVDYITRPMDMDSDNPFVTNVDDDSIGTVTVPHEVSTDSVDSLRMFPRFSRDNIDEDTAERKVKRLFSSRDTESRTNDKDETAFSDEDEWTEEVVETFVVPLPLERTILNVKDSLHEGNFQGSLRPYSHDVQHDDDEFQSTCTTTMIEVEGQGTFGVRGDEYYTSEYDDQFNVPARTDQDLNKRLGFRLNLSNYKTDEYATEDGWPIVRMIEQERVYIQEGGLGEESYQDDEDNIRNTREMPKDGGLYRRQDIRSEAEDERYERNEEEEEDMHQDYEEYKEDIIHINTIHPFRKDSPEHHESDRTILSQFPVKETSVLTTHWSQFPLPSSLGQRTTPEFSSTRSSRGDNIPSATEAPSSDFGYFSSSSERPVHSWSARKEENRPLTTSLYKHFASSQPDIFQSAFSSVDTLEKHLGNFSTSASNFPSRGSSASNYDDFVRHISDNDDKPENTGLASPRNAILSGNIITSQKMDAQVVSTGEQSSLLTERPYYEDNDNDESYELDKKEDTRHERAEEGEENVFPDKPRFIRTSTAQDEKELLGNKSDATKQLTSDSLNDESTSVLNRSFDETFQGSFTYERSSSGLVQLNRSKSREGEMRIRSGEMSKSDLSSIDFGGFPVSPRQPYPSVSIGRSMLGPVPKTESSSGGTFSITLPLSDKLASETNQIPPASSPPAMWSRVIPGSNFIEEKLSPSCENESVKMEFLSSTHAFGQETKPRSDQENLGDFTKKNDNQISAPFHVNQSDTLLASPSENGGQNSDLLGFSQAASGVKPSVTSSPSSFYTKGSSLFSSSTKTALDKIAATYRTGQQDTPDFAQYRVEKSDTKERVSNEIINSQETDLIDSKFYDNEDNTIKSRETWDKREDGFIVEEKGKEVYEDFEYDEDVQREISNLEQLSKPDKLSKVYHSAESTDDIYPPDSSSASLTSSSSTSVLESPRTTVTPLPANTATPISGHTPTGGQTQAASAAIKKPRSLREIKRRHKQSYKSVLTQDPTTSITPAPKAAPFVLPDKLITPSRLQIIQSRNRFLSEQNLHTESYTDEFEAHKENLTQTVIPMKERKYTPKMTKRPNYRSQEQLEKILYMVNLKPGRSESSLNLDCLHDDCILSEKGRREILDKTLSIDNLDADLHGCLRRLCSNTDYTLSDAYYPDTNSDLFDLTFAQQDGSGRILDRPASMGELHHASHYATISGSGSAFNDQGRFTHQKYEKSKSLGTLDSNQNSADSTSPNTPDVFQRPPSAQEIRLSKSLQKLNVPDWYKLSSLSKSSGYLYENRPFSSLPWDLSNSQVSSPSTTPSLTSNVIIKSRVLFPTSNRNLRSPRFPSKSTPTTPSFTSQTDDDTPTTVQLPSEKLRSTEKLKSLMPIPIVPYEKVKAKLDQKQMEEKNAQTETNENRTTLTKQHGTVTQIKPSPPQSSIAIVGKDTVDHSEEDAGSKITESRNDTSTNTILRISENEIRYSSIRKLQYKEKTIFGHVTERTSETSQHFAVSQTSTSNHQIHRLMSEYSDHDTSSETLGRGSDRPKIRILPVILSETAGERLKTQPMQMMLSQTSTESPKSAPVTLSQTATGRLKTQPVPVVSSQTSAERPKHQPVSVILSQTSAERPIHQPASVILSQTSAERPIHQPASVILSQTSNERPKLYHVPVVSSQTSTKGPKPQPMPLILSQTLSERTKPQSTTPMLLSQTSQQELKTSKSEFLPPVILPQSSIAVPPEPIQYPQKSNLGDARFKTSARLSREPQKQLEQPKPMDLKHVQMTTEEPEPLHIETKKWWFSENIKEDLQRPSGEVREFGKPSRFSSSSSNECLEDERHKIDDDNERRSDDASSADSTDMFPTSRDRTLSPGSASSPPTIVISPVSARQRDLDYVNVAMIGPKVGVATLEGVPVIRPPDQKPLIAPVIENQTINDQNSYFADHSIQDTFRKTRPPDPDHETEPKITFQSDTCASDKPTQVEPSIETKRSWVPKPKPSRRKTSPDEPRKTTEEDHIYVNYKITGLEPSNESQRLVGEAQHPRPITESEIHEESFTSEDYRLAGSRNDIDRPSVRLSQESRPVARARDFDRSLDSESYRSVDTSRELNVDSLYNTRNLERRSSNESTPSFNRNLDLVLDHYTRPNGSDSESGIPTEADHSRTSIKERLDTSNENAARDAFSKTDDTRDLQRWKPKPKDGKHINDRLGQKYDRKFTGMSERDFVMNEQNYDREVNDRMERNDDTISGREYDINVKDDTVSDIYYNVNEQGFYRPDNGTRKMIFDTQEREVDNNYRDFDSRNRLDKDERDESYSSLGETNYDRIERMFSESDLTRQPQDWTLSEDSLNYSEASRQTARGHDDGRSYMPRSSRDVSSKVKLHKSSDNIDGAADICKKPSGRTWQPKPRSRSRGFDPSPPKRAKSVGDNLMSAKPSVHSNGTATTSPYRYRVAGSAFNSAKPDTVAGITPPPEKRTLRPLSSITTAEIASLMKETPV